MWLRLTSAAPWYCVFYLQSFLLSLRARQFLFISLSYIKFWVIFDGFSSAWWTSSSKSRVHGAPQSASMFGMYLFLTAVFVFWQQWYVMKWIGAENICDSCFLQLNHYQWTLQKCILPSCTVSSCITQRMNDNWCENQLSWADCKLKAHYQETAEVVPQSILSLYCEVGDWKLFSLQTCFASKWYIFGHGFLTKLYLISPFSNP